MRILFVVDGFHHPFSANSLIIKSLSEQLIKNGNDVFIRALSGGKNLPQTEVRNGIHISRTINGDDKQSLIELIKRLRFGDASKILFNWIAKKCGVNSIWLKEIVSERYAIEKLIWKQNIDMVISVNCSVECSFPIYYLKKKNKLPCKWIMYMLDPFATHSYYRENYDDIELHKVQYELFVSCDEIMCSDVIVSEINQYDEDIVKKVQIAEYPKIQDFGVYTKENPFDKKNIHCVYAGTFNQAVRSADYLFGVIDRLRDTDLLFHFMGNGWEQGNEFDNSERTNCIFRGKMVWEDVISLECNCDFLINIGNQVKNQFPSKVLEYMCTGNPIIDFSKHRQGLTEPYLTTYPDALIIYEDENIDDAVRQMRCFVGQEHHKIDYQTIRNLFITATPEYVAQQIEEVFNKQEKL